MVVTSTSADHPFVGFLILIPTSTMDPDPVGSALFARSAFRACRSVAVTLTVSTNCKSELYFFLENLKILSEIIKLLFDSVDWHCCGLKFKKLF
jgi:hypothetical protein